MVLSGKPRDAPRSVTRQVYPTSATRTSSTTVRYTQLTPTRFKDFWDD